MLSLQGRPAKPHKMPTRPHAHGKSPTDPPYKSKHQLTLCLSKHSNSPSPANILTLARPRPSHHTHAHDLGTMCC